jgi:hypothetical protein
VYAWCNIEIHSFPNAEQIGGQTSPFMNLGNFRQLSSWMGRSDLIFEGSESSLPFDIWHSNNWTVCALILERITDESQSNLWISRGRIPNLVRTCHISLKIVTAILCKSQRTGRPLFVPMTQALISSAFQLIGLCELSSPSQSVLLISPSDRKCTSWEAKSKSTGCC